jgi:hypothetical protein
MVQPISMNLAYLNVERAAQFSKESIAPAQQTALISEVVKESIRKDQTVQPGQDVIQVNKVHRKTDEERRQKNGSQQESGKQESPLEEERHEAVNMAAPRKTGRFDSYA